MFPLVGRKMKMRLKNKYKELSPRMISRMLDANRKISQIKLVLCVSLVGRKIKLKVKQNQNLKVNENSFMKTKMHNVQTMKIKR